MLEISIKVFKITNKKQVITLFAGVLSENEDLVTNTYKTSI